MSLKITYCSIHVMETTASISVCFLTPLLHSIIVKIEEELNMSLSLEYFHTSMNLWRLILKTNLSHIILTRQQVTKTKKQYDDYSTCFSPPHTVSPFVLENAQLIIWSSIFMNLLGKQV